MGRLALRPNVQRARVSRGISIPSPVQGWDAITPLAEMPPERAIQLDNFFPQAGYIELRRDGIIHADTGTLAPVESGMAYHAPSSANDKLFAASGTKIYDVTSANTAPAVLNGLTNARWQHVNFATSGGNFLWICNGVDAPRYWDGASWNVATITGGLADFVQAAVFKGRLWLAMVGKLDAAYLPVDSIQGEAAVFALSGVFSKGGFLQAIATWALDGGDGPDDYLAFISSRGQVAVYTGSLPSGEAADFALRGVYDMGPPIGRRCVTRVAGDLAVICQDGVLPLSQALITDRAASLNASITKLIQPVMNQSARDWGSNYGWQLTGYPKGTAAILNVPVAEGFEQRQYVMNTVTGAWCRYLGQNANWFEVFKDRLFFGGNDGRVYEADAAGLGVSGQLQADVRTAFNYCGRKGQLKRWTMCRPLLVTDGQIEPSLTINVDFADAALPVAAQSVVPTAAIYGQAIYGQAIYGSSRQIVTDWHTVQGAGYCASIHMRVLLGG